MEGRDGDRVARLSDRSHLDAERTDGQVLGDLQTGGRAGVRSSGEVKRWKKGVWSVHWVDIYSAVAAGCPVNIAELKEAAGDEDTWLQEYCCVFLADAENYIPLELIRRC
jgi:hypothetical protein